MFGWLGQAVEPVFKTQILGPRVPIAKTAPPFFHPPAWNTGPQEGIPGSMRRIFIGDIQGCRVELEELLEKLRFDPAADELHPVGDLVNRGPDSMGVLQLLRGLGARGVLGNHDLHALAALQGRARQDDRDTIADLVQDPEGPALLRWLAQRP